MTIPQDELITRPDGSKIAFGDLKPRDQLAHELVMGLIPKVLELQAALAKFRDDSVGQVLAYRDMMMSDYGVKVGGTQGNISLRSECGRWLIKYQIQNTISFKGELEAAKALIFECLNEWTSQAGEELKEFVTRVFQLNSKGRIDTHEILGLSKMNITDERWLEAMRAIDDAVKRDFAATYINFYSVNPKTRVETRIPLDIAKLGSQEVV